MNFLGLANIIEEAAAEAFSEVLNKNPGHSFCGYALYSDADAVTVCPAINSRENLARMIAKDPDDVSYYKWNTAEWTMNSRARPSGLMQFPPAQF